MNNRRNVFEAAVKLAVALSALAVALAVVMHSTVGVDPLGLAAIVGVVGFVASWNLAGRAPRPRPVGSHRVAIVPVRHRVA